MRQCARTMAAVALALAVWMTPIVVGDDTDAWPPEVQVKSCSPSQAAQAARTLRRSMACEACGGDGTITRQRTRRPDKVFAKGEIYHEQDQCRVCDGTGTAKPEVIMKRFDTLVTCMAGCSTSLSTNAAATRVLADVFESICAFARTASAEAIDRAAQRLAGGFGDTPGTPLIAIGIMQDPAELGLGVATPVFELPSGALIALDALQFKNTKAGDRVLGTGIVRGHVLVGNDDYLVVDRGVALMVTSKHELELAAEEEERRRDAAREQRHEPTPPAPAPEPESEPE